MMKALILYALIFGMSPVEAKAWAYLAFEGRATEFACASEIIQAESSWRPNAVGDGGESFGLAQRHAPVHGMPELPWPVVRQMQWFTDYADERYGNWCHAARVRRIQGWW